jgi:hypothetical protein
MLPALKNNAKRNIFRKNYTPHEKGEDGERIEERIGDS